MQAIEFSTQESEKPGYSLATLKRTDGRLFTSADANGPIGAAVGLLITRIEALSYLPLDTRHRESLPDDNSIRVQVGDTREAIVQMEGNPFDVIELKIQLPTYVAKDDRLQRHIEEFNSAIRKI